MKKVYATLGICALLVTGPALSTAEAASYFANGVNLQSGWLDVDKQQGGSTNHGGFSDDDWMLCWAATAANVLTYTQWDPGTSALANSSNYAGRNGAMFQHFVDHFDGDDGGYIKPAYDWWLNGDYAFSSSNPNRDNQFYSGAQPDVAGGGGFFSSATFSNYYDGGLYSHKLSSLQAALQNGFGVGIGITTGQGGHAITVWGYEWDQMVQGASREWHNITGLYVTDSDDMSHQLAYYDITSHGSITSGRYDGWSLDEVQAFAFNDNPVATPIPGAVWLLGSGLVGLVGMRRRSNPQP